MKIKCAAIIYNGTIYEGESHCKIGHKMLSNKVCNRPFPVGVAQGFVTEDGKFVSREEAFIMAMNEGQIELGKTSHSRQLFSEDLRKTTRFYK
jgi:hypothetical protein